MKLQKATLKKARDIVFGIFIMLGATFVFIPFIFSSIYFAERLYNTGTVQTLKISKKTKQISIGRESVLIWYDIAFENSKLTVEVSDSQGPKLKKGDIIRVLYSPKTKMSMYCEDSRPTLLFTLMHYDQGGGSIIIVTCIGLILSILVSLYYSLKGIVVNVLIETKTKLKPENTAIETLGVYFKSLLPLTSLLVFAYVLSGFAIQMILMVEGQEMLLVMNVVTYSILFALFSPVAISAFLDFLKNTQNKTIRNTRVIIATFLSIYLTVKTFHFTTTSDFKKYENVQKVGVDLLKYIFTI